MCINPTERVPQDTTPICNVRVQGRVHSIINYISGELVSVWREREREIFVSSVSNFYSSCAYTIILEMYVPAVVMNTRNCWTPEVNFICCQKVEELFWATKCVFLNELQLFAAFKILYPWLEFQDSYSCSSGDVWLYFSNINSLCPSDIRIMSVCLNQSVPVWTQLGAS